MAAITTVLGDITAEKLGFCQPHEHVYIVETPALLTHEELRISNLPASIEELKQYRAAGGNSLVDAQPIATGRDARALEEASLVSGVSIIASTGYHIPIFYNSEHWIWKADEDKLAELFADELSHGMYLGGCFGWPKYQTNIRAGIVKAMITDERVTGRAEVLLRAAGTAAANAGAALMLHTEYGKGAIDALNLLDKLGLPPERVLICHVDRQAEDYTIHEEIAASGANLEYDTITLFEFHDNESEVKLILNMIEKGYLNQLLISTDPTADRLRNYGGKVGMDYIHTTFLPKLKAAGISNEQILQIIKNNPANILQKIKTV
jgi:phosphotriesterase-related protein